RDAAACRELYRERGMGHAQPHLDDRFLHPRGRRPGVPLEPRPLAPSRRTGWRRPVGGTNARMGDDLATARAQLRRVAAHPFRATAVGPAPSTTRARREVSSVKNEVRLFLGVTVFLVVIGTVYWLASYED